jgi:uncharacterized protein (DUF427 family)
MTSGPGYKKDPSHRVATRPAGRRVLVRFKGEVIADSVNAVEMEEGTYPRVFYVPRADAKMDRLVKSSHKTYCPYKGDASYFSVKDGPENAVWSYETPYDEVVSIGEHLAFYPDKFEIRAET